jgi:hypothetical protein
MIDCLIFTKDRACQLELLLRSINDNMPEIKEITIIAKASNSEFLRGYELVANKYNQYRWIREQNLVTDIKRTVAGFKNPYCVTFVDDEVVVNNNPIRPACMLLNLHKEIHAVSLRMHTSIDYTYTSNTQSPTPIFNRYDGHGEPPATLFEWEWSKHPNATDWGYPSCINSHIYRTEQFKQLVIPPNYRNVNEMEGVINNQRNTFAPNMVCFENPSTINIANNLVQDGMNRHGHNPEADIKTLNARLMSGKIISSKELYGYKTNTATFEMDYNFEDIK